MSTENNNKKHIIFSITESITIFENVQAYLNKKLYHLIINDIEAAFNLAISAVVSLHKENIVNISYEIEKLHYFSDLLIKSVNDEQYNSRIYNKQVIYYLEEILKKLK